MTTSRVILFASITCSLLLTSLEGCSSTTENPNGESATEDSVEVAAGKQYKKNPLHNFIFGKHYRDLWAEKVKLPVFDLNTVKGGLKPVKVGGSQQTVSIHLLDSAGRRYVLRGVDKDQSKALEQPLRNTVLSRLFIDQTSALNPYAAMVVDELAEAAEIYHTNPQYYYVPEQEGFEDYDGVVGKIALLEEKPNSSWASEDVFNNPEDIIETDDMAKELYENPNAFVDEKLFLKSRLFDFIINDWDRHGNQWEWLKFHNGDSIFYQPVPRDRDMAFYIFDDGVLPFLVSRWWGVPKFQTFHRYYEYIPGLISNSEELDNLILEGLPWESWDKTICELQEDLSDEKIEKTISGWPENIYKHRGKETIRNLKERRDRLTDAAWQFYNLVNEEICVRGTEEDEFVKIQRLPEGKTHVVVSSQKSGLILFERILSSDVTDRIVVASLGGADKIQIDGKAGKGIVLHVYTGKDKDAVTDNSTVRGFRKYTRIYHQEEDILQVNSDTFTKVVEEEKDEKFTISDDL